MNDEHGLTDLLDGMIPAQSADGTWYWKSFAMHVAEAIDFFFSAPSDLPAGELRQQIIERFGAEVDAELRRRFTAQRRESAP